MPDLIRRLQRPKMRRIDFVVGDGLEIYCRFRDPVTLVPYDLTGAVITGQVRQLLPGVGILCTFVTTSSDLVNGIVIATIADTTAIVAPNGTKADANEVRSARFDIQMTDAGFCKTFISGPIYRIQQVTQ